MSSNHGIQLSESEILSTFATEPNSSRFPPILTIKQAADLLQASVNTVRSWRARGMLDGCGRRCGRQVRIFRDRLIRWYFNGDAAPSADSIPNSTAIVQAELPAYRLYQRGKLWYVLFRRDGVRTRRSLKTSDESIARDRVIKLLTEPETASEPKSDVEEITLRYVTEEFIRHAEAEQLAPRTIAKYRWTMKQINKLAGQMRVVRLRQIDFAFLDAYRLSRKSAGSAEKTIFNEVVAFKQLLNFAVSRGVLEKSPLKDVRLRKPKPRPQPFWTIEEVRRVLDAAMKSPYYDVYLFLAETGMRIGEVRFLSWADIDFDHAIAYVREKRVGKRPSDVWKPKSGRQRSVPLSADVIEMLRQRPHNGRWVFRRPIREGVRSSVTQINDRSVLSHLKRILKRIGLAGHVHTFRHSFISHALIRGVPEAMVREWVGHMDSETIRHYTHVADQQSRACMDRIFPCTSWLTKCAEIDAGKPSCENA